MFWEEEYLKKKPMFLVCLKSAFFFRLAGGENAQEDKLKHLIVDFKVLLIR